MTSNMATTPSDHKTPNAERRTPNASANRITRCFRALRGKNKKAFIAYVCAGDPSLDATADIVVAMAESGVDIVELGIPFTDPMADGQANQDAASRALAAGASVAGVLDCVRRIRARSQVPLLFFTYLNPIVAYGPERFAVDAVAAGADGILLLDLPPDEDPALLNLMRSAGLANICLAAPTTSAGRKRFLAKQSRGFLYYVCRLGVTGERAELPADLGEQVAALKAAGKAPVCIGFGISTPEQAALAAAQGDGVIVGSHLVKMIGQLGHDPELARLVAARAGAMAAAVHAL